LGVGIFGYWLRLDAPLAESVRDASGGVAYVIFWILVLGSIARRSSAGHVAFLVFAVTCVLEFLQLWHPPWLEAIRSTLPGRLVIGTTFEWTDFPPYAVGALIGWWLVRVLSRVG
jgi:hypothetical protein